MARARSTFSAEFKAKVALEAIKGLKTINELAREFQVHPNAISLWKKQMLENIAEVFSSKRGPKTESNEELTDKLYRQIGKLQVELDWLKKKYESLG